MVNNKFYTNKYFGTTVYQYFTERSVSISDVQIMIESLKHNLDNTDKMLRMFKDLYHDEDSIFKALYVLKISAVSSAALSKYIAANF